MGERLGSVGSAYTPRIGAPPVGSIRASAPVFERFSNISPSRPPQFSPSFKILGVIPRPEGLSSKINSPNPIKSNPLSWPEHKFQPEFGTKNPGIAINRGEFQQLKNAPKLEIKKPTNEGPLQKPSEFLKKTTVYKLTPSNFVKQVLTDRQIGDLPGLKKAETPMPSTKPIPEVPVAAPKFSSEIKTQTTPETITALKAINLEPAVNARLSLLEKPKVTFPEAKTTAKKAQTTLSEAQSEPRPEQIKKDAPKVELIALAKTSEQLINTKEFTNLQIEQALINSFKQNQVLSEKLPDEESIKIIVQQIIKLKQAQKNEQEEVEREGVNYVFDKKTQQSRVNIALKGMENLKNYQASIDQTEEIFGSDIFKVLPGQTEEVKSQAVKEPSLLTNFRDGSWDEAKLEIYHAGKFESYQKAWEFILSVFDKKPPIKAEVTRYSNIKTEDVKRVFNQDQEIESLLRMLLNASTPNSNPSQTKPLLG